MKIIIESEILKKLVQPSLIEILFFLKDQKKTETQLAYLLHSDTEDVRFALERLMEKGLVRANENELMKHLYELTTDGRRLFDVSGYRAFFFMGISGYILCQWRNKNVQMWRNNFVHSTT